jgi:hypothetical protein
MCATLQLCESKMVIRTGTEKKCLNVSCDFQKQCCSLSIAHNFHSFRNVHNSDYLKLHFIKLHRLHLHMLHPHGKLFAAWPYGCKLRPLERSQPVFDLFVHCVCFTCLTCTFSILLPTLSAAVWVESALSQMKDSVCVVWKRRWCFSILSCIIIVMKIQHQSNQSCKMILVSSY